MDICHRVKILQNETVWANAAKMPPEAWYEMCVKPWHPILAMVGMSVLSQVISASSCERNWSAHRHIQTKIRNKLSPETTEKLVYDYSNSKMQARRHRGQLPPPFCKLVVKHQDVSPRGGLGGSHSIWQVVQRSPPPPALRGPVHRSRSVPPTAYIGGGFRLFPSVGARAPRPDGGGPPGRSLDRPSSPLAVLVGDARALPLAVPALASLLARLGVLACEAVFPGPFVLRRLAAPCVLPCSFPCF